MMNQLEWQTQLRIGTDCENFATLARVPSALGSGKFHLVPVVALDKSQKCREKDCYCAEMLGKFLQKEMPVLLLIHHLKQARDLEGFFFCSH